MEPIKEFVAAVFSDQRVNIVLGLVVALPIIDWVTGSLRAIASKTFSWDAFDVFVRTQIAGRAVPLVILIIVGRVITVAVPDTMQIPGLDLSLLTGAGILAAIPFLAVGIGSIISNVNPNVTDTVPTVTETK
jgi:hypothetical protein